MNRLLPLRMSRFQGQRGPNNYNKDRKPQYQRDDGEPIDALQFVHVIACPERDMALLKCLDNNKVPRFGAPVMYKGYQIGTVEDVLGPVSGHYAAMKPQVGVQVGYLKKDVILQIGDKALLDIQRFLPYPPVKKVKQPRGQGGPQARFGKPGFGKGGQGFNRGGPRRDGPRDNFRRDGPRYPGFRDRGAERGGFRPSGSGRFNK